MEYIANYGTANIKVDGRVLAEEKKAQAAVEYEVKLGDVLWKIAEKFGLTYEKLAEYNKLKDANRIYPGQRLLIPEF